MKVYISGQISDLTEHEYTENFAQGMREVEAMGHTPCSPVSLPHNHDKRWASYMRESLAQLLRCEGIYMLKNYPKSRGANIEHNLARLLDFEIIYQK